MWTRAWRFAWSMPAVVVTADDRSETYDLDTDPSEQRDGAEPPMELASLRQTLTALDTTTAVGDVGEAAVVNPPPLAAAEERLRALRCDW